MMSPNITEETFSSLADQWSRLQHVRWGSIFALPAWLQVWWQEYSPEACPSLLAVRQDEELLGIAPFLIAEEKASFLCSTDVCDYLDFVIAPGQERGFFIALLDHLKERSVKQLDLGAVRPESSALKSLVPIAGERGCPVKSEQEDVSVELDLPDTWDEYLELLEAKQRHELKRKLRRLSAEGSVVYRSVSMLDELNGCMDSFLTMFTESRRDKAAFLTARRESFFRSLVSGTAQIGIARFGILELDGVTAAMLLYFVYGDRVYLYNSGYEPRYESLSVGLICKALCIKDSIEKGFKVFDFLKGNETYKYHLGGKEVPLYRCQITIQ
ncbi:MAG: GNAT family N-acetyltransferase [Chloroflexi bacterium]|nr:GNAT family N-acetyltransferase [Chloroflexota bacterium]